MTIQTAGSVPAAAVCAAANDNVFDRAAHIHPGHRFYSSAAWLRHLLTPTPSNWYKSRGTPVEWREGKPKREGGKLVPQPGEWVRKRNSTPSAEPETDRQYWIGSASRDNQRPAGERWLGEDNYGPPAGHMSKAVAIWATLPKDDSKIFARQAKTDTPKHAKLADRCKPTLIYRDGSKPIEPAQTNWCAANDDTSDDSPWMAANPDRAHDCGATPDLMVRKAEDALEKGDIEYGTFVDDEDNEHAIVVRIGKMRFSNGAQFEKHLMLDATDTVYLGDVRMPVGAMLNCVDRPGKALGPARPTRNDFYAELHGTEAHRYVPNTKRPERREKVSKEDQRAILADAYANTPTLPTVTHCSPALPCGGRNMADIFMAGVSHGGDNCNCPPEPWEDAFTAMAQAGTYATWVAELKPEDKKMLDAALVAPNFAELGKAAGRSRKAAERKGRQMLLAANDNFAEILKKAA